MVTEYDDELKILETRFATWKIIWEYRASLIHAFLIHIAFHWKQKMKSISLGTSDTYSGIPLFQRNYLISVVTAIICNLPRTIFLLVTCGFLGVSVLLGTYKALSSMNLRNHCAPLHCCLWMLIMDSERESSAKRTAQSSPLTVELSAAFLPSKWTSLVGVVLEDCVLWPKSGSFFSWNPFSHVLHVFQLPSKGRESSYKQECSLRNSESSPAHHPSSAPLDLEPCG